MEIVRRAEHVIYQLGDAIVIKKQTSSAAIIAISGTCLYLNYNGGPSQKPCGEIVPEGTMVAELAMLSSSRPQRSLPMDP